MFGGLLISGVTAYFIATTPATMAALMENSGLFLIIVIVQIILVV